MSIKLLQSHCYCCISIDKDCVFKWCFSVVVGFICNVVRPLFTEWHRLLVSPLSLLLLDNLQANLRRWQSFSIDNVSQLTVADSSDDSSPPNADHGDRELLNMSSEVGPTKPHVTHSDSDRSCVQYGPQTENVLRRASLPLMSATAIAGVTVRRGSSPVVGSQHTSCRRVYYLSSLVEDSAPLIAAPSTPCCKKPNISTELDVSRSEYNDGLNNICNNGHKDIILTDNSSCLSDALSRHCSVHTDSAVQFSECDLTPVINVNDNSGLNGALLNGVSRMLPNYTGVRRGSAPVVCSARLPAACASRRCSAPSPGAELIALSLLTSKLPFSAKPSSAVCSRKPSVVLVESPRLGIGVDQLSFFCLLTNNGSLKVPLEPSVACCREKRSHSAHAVVINPARFVERRYSSPLNLQQCWNASNLINQSSSSNYTPSISGFVWTVDFISPSFVTLPWQ